MAAARQAGVRVIMFSEHPASHYDYVNDGHRGLKDGVLLIPGAETGGFLAYPKRSIQKREVRGPAGILRPGARDRRTDLPVPPGRADGLGDRRPDRQRNLQHARRLQGRAEVHRRAALAA